MARKHHAPWVPSPADLALTAQLARPHQDLAWLPVGDQVLHTSVTPAAHAPRSAVLDLVQGVYERCPGQAHAALRSRIRTTTARNERDRSVVKVAAKRCTWGLAPRPGTLPDVELVDVSADAARARDRARRAALAPPAIDVRAWLAAPDIRAVLLDAEGRPLWAARNDPDPNRTLHAEVCLLQGFAAPLPPGSTVLVGLQPCRMCAALLVHAATGPLEVRYLAPDPGPFARGTALQALGWEHPL